MFTFAFLSNRRLYSLHDSEFFLFSDQEKSLNCKSFENIFHLKFFFSISFDDFFWWMKNFEYLFFFFSFLIQKLVKFQKFAVEILC